MHIQYPDIPHDFYAYIAGAKALLSGKPLYGIVFENTGLTFMYGPLTGIIFAVFIWVFGENYILLKFPSIIFDSLTIILVFYTIKELTNNERIAKFGSLFYSFSYMPILNSGVLGQNDPLFVFFILLSIYLLIKDRYILAGISLGIGIGFLIIPLLIFPAGVYYIYKRFNLLSAFKYIAVLGITFIIILTIFYINSGTKVFYPYSGYYHTYPVAMLSPLNFIKTLIGLIINIIHFLTTHTVIPKEINPISSQTHPLSIVFNQIAVVVFFGGYLLLFLYMLRFKISNIKVELIRNSTLLVLGVLIFSKYVPGPYYFWVTPLLLILIIILEQENFEGFRVKKCEKIGIVLTFIGLLIYAMLYRWRSDISEIERIMLILTPFLISLGTYLMLYRTTIAKSWAILMFGCASFEMSNANPLLILNPLLIKFIPEIPIAHGTYLSYASNYSFSFIVLGITLLGIILLAKDMHCLMRK